MKPQRAPERWSPEVRAEDARLRSLPIVREHFGDLLAIFPDHPITMIGSTVFWVGTKLARYIVDQYHPLKHVSVLVSAGLIPMEEQMRFYRDLGYPLSGYIELFGDYLKLFQEEELQVS